MVQEQRPGNIRYFVAKFGEGHEDEYRVEGGCYPLSHRYWPGNFSSSTPNNPIRIGDVVLLYCFQNYTGYQDEIQGLGIGYRIDEGNDRNILWYHYLPLIPSIDCNTIRTQLTQAGLLQDLHNILEVGRTPYCHLHMITNESAHTLLSGVQIDWR